MVISICSNNSHSTTHSIQESHFLQSFSQAVSGDRMLEIAKIIAAIAIIALSFVAVVGGIYWLFFRKHAQPVDSNATDRQSQSPLPQILKKDVGLSELDEEELSEDEEDEELDELLTKSSSRPEHPASVVRSQSPQQGISIAAPTQIKTKSHFNLDEIKEVLPLSLVDEDQLKQNLIDAFYLIRTIDQHMRHRFIFPATLPDITVLNRINQLKSFQSDTRNYEILENQLTQYAEVYFSIICRQEKKVTSDDPLMKLFFQVYTDKLSPVVGALIQKLYNEGKFGLCAPMIKKIQMNPDLQDAFFAALGRHYLHLGGVAQAELILKEGSTHKGEVKTLWLHIAKIYFNQKDLEKAHHVVKDMFSCDEKNELLLEIAKHYFVQSDYKQALKALKEMSSTDERKELILKIAQHYVVESDLDQALQIAKNMSYSKERDDFILAIAKDYFKQKDLEKALKIAKDMSYSEERDDLIFDIAVAHYRAGEHQLAIKIVKDRSYSKKRDELIQQMQQGATL